MSRSSILVPAAAMALLLLPSSAFAANTIQISSQSVTATSITCSGTYALDAGWSVVSITLKVKPTSGGAGLAQSANYASGNWGPATISGLTTGVSYDVWVEMVVRNGDNQQTIYSVTTKLSPAEQ